ncbi:hypothetical protein Fmac_026001 [Flemingia macrophylla]|uniref:Uncharacterized protein n=1 Tax=Flemingia macrophylla TaxID=520843 RepID=A0ABD1LDP2_9FABA
MVYLKPSCMPHLKGLMKHLSHAILEALDIVLKVNKEMVLGEDMVSTKRKSYSFCLLKKPFKEALSDLGAFNVIQHSFKQRFERVEQLVDEESGAVSCRTEYGESIVRDSGNLAFWVLAALKTLTEVAAGL